MLGIALLGLGRFVGGTPTLRRTIALSAYGFLPGAVHSLLAGAAALARHAIRPEELHALVPPAFGRPDGAPLERLAAGLGPFSLWAVVLVALGMPAAAALPRRKAIVTVALGFLVYVLVSRMIAGGAPAGGPPAGGHP
jgi:hypothetical protein